MMKLRYKISYLTVLGLAISACEQAAEAPLPPRPALVIKVGETSTQNGMVLVGEIKPRYESSQGFRIGGKVIERKIEVGAEVKKGQLLARLDASDAQLSASAAQANVHAAEANYALAKSEVERQRQLVNQKFVSASTLDKFEANLKTASAQVSQAKASAAVTGNQSRYNALFADRNGVVTFVRAEPGQVVQAGEVVVKIADMQQFEVQVAVPESRMSALKVNDAVEVKLWAEQGKIYAGKVREIAPAANSATRAFDVKVAVEHDEKMRLGMTAGVRFGQVETADLLVPNTAITQKNGKTLVWVIDTQGFAQPREVQIGAFSELGTPVLNGLKSGEMVAVAGVHTLVAGMRVRPTLEAQP